MRLKSLRKKFNINGEINKNKNLLIKKEGSEKIGIKNRLISTSRVRLIPVI
jgi:hypothetical protein